MGLSAAQLASYRRDGFLVIEGFVAPSVCRELIARAGALTAAFDPEGVRSIFTTNEQTRTTDDYFLESGDKVRFFFEEEAFAADGSLRADKALAINKIGHALHDLDPVFARFSRDPRLAEIAADLGMAEPLLLQSMYIFKQPYIGGEVTLHQDASFLITEPPSVVGFWFALEDATVENGCMWALPGAHQGPLRRLFRREGHGVRFEELDDTPWPDCPEMPLEAPQGTLVLLHGLCPHRSGANRSPRSRHAYALHAVDGACPYSDYNWLQRSPANPARGFA